MSSSRSYRITFEDFLFTFYTKSLTINCCTDFSLEKYYTVHLTTQEKNIIDHFTKYLPLLSAIQPVMTTNKTARIDHPLHSNFEVPLL